MRFNPFVTGKETATGCAQREGVQKLKSIGDLLRLFTSTPFFLPDEVLKDEIENQTSKRLKIETRRGENPRCP